MKQDFIKDYIQLLNFPLRNEVGRWQWAWDSDDVHVSCEPSWAVLWTPLVMTRGCVNVLLHIAKHFWCSKRTKLFGRKYIGHQWQKSKFSSWQPLSCVLRRRLHGSAVTELLQVGQGLVCRSWLCSAMMPAALRSSSQFCLSFYLFFFPTPVSYFKVEGSVLSGVLNLIYLVSAAVAPADLWQSRRASPSLPCSVPSSHPAPFSGTSTEPRAPTSGQSPTATLHWAGQ